MPQILQQRPSAALGHHQIEHDSVVGHFAEHELRFVAITRDVHSKMRFAQRAAQRACQISLVFDNKYSHGFGAGLPPAFGGSSISSSMRKSSNSTVESPLVHSPTFAEMRGMRSRSANTRIPPRYTRITPCS